MGGEAGPSPGALPAGFGLRASAALAAAGLSPAPVRSPQQVERMVLQPIHLDLKPPGGLR
jgi:hypothetical protein